MKVCARKLFLCEAVAFHMPWVQIFLESRANGQCKNQEHGRLRVSQRDFRPTISKYFNDPDSVRKSTRARIEAALERYDYRPNIYAINQNRQQTKNIGLVVPNLTDPFFAGIARMIEEKIIVAGFNPLLLSSHGGPDQEIANLDSLRAIKPAGVLLAPLGRASHAEMVAAFAEEIPTVLFDANLDGIGEAFFGSDNAQSIGLMVDYLCRTGEPPAFFEMKTPINRTPINAAWPISRRWNGCHMPPRI